jgi:hypothetical protein
MAYAGLVPSMNAIQQAVREPLSQAPHDYQQFAIYIFERARAIDREKALADQAADKEAGKYTFQWGQLR